MLEKTKKLIISILKDPIRNSLNTAWYIICVGVGLLTILYTLAFIKYHLVTAWKILGL